MEKTKFRTALVSKSTNGVSFKNDCLFFQTQSKYKLLFGEVYTNKTVRKSTNAIHAINWLYFKPKDTEKSTTAANLLHAYMPTIGFITNVNKTTRKMQMQTGSWPNCAQINLFFVAIAAVLFYVFDGFNKVV